MPRSLNAARKRRARFADAVRQFAFARLDPAGFPAYVRRLAASPLCAWRVAEAAAAMSGIPLDDDERDTLARAIAPRLAATTDGNARRRAAERPVLTFT